MTGLPEQEPEEISAQVLSQSWEYADADTQYLTHNIHRYSGKFIPQIAARAISLLTQPGDLVLDPYCGSGTTLLESAIHGRKAVGIDLNPLAVLIARAKTTPIPQPELKRLVPTLRNVLFWGDAGTSLPLFRSLPVENFSRPERDPRFFCSWYRKWFQPGVLKDLITIDLAIREVDDPALRSVAWVAFSDILRRCSNAHSGYPNVMFDKKAPAKGPTVPLFFKTLKRNVEMVGSLNKVSGSWPDVAVIRGSATAVPLASRTVGAVISHPPYIGSIPYAEYGSLSLQWLGVDPKQIDRNLTGGRRQSKDVVQRFEEGYREMISECHRVLRPGRYASLMVGNPTVRGELVDLAEMTLQFANDVGLELVARAERCGMNRRANNMGAEHLLFFRKPSEF